MQAAAHYVWVVLVVASEDSTLLLMALPAMAKLLQCCILVCMQASDCVSEDVSVVQIWRQAFDQIIVAVMIFQLLMIGLVGLKRAPIQAGCLVPLPIITIIFR